MPCWQALQVPHMKSLKQLKAPRRCLYFGHLDSKHNSKVCPLLFYGAINKPDMQVSICWGEWQRNTSEYPERWSFMDCSRFCSPEWRCKRFYKADPTAAAQVSAFQCFLQAAHRDAMISGSVASLKAARRVVSPQGKETWGWMLLSGWLLSSRTAVKSHTEMCLHNAGTFRKISWPWFEVICC